MLINLSSIKNGRDNKETFEDTFELNVEHGKRVGALHVSPISFKGEIKLVDGRLFISCHFNSDFTFNCDRCLKEVNLHIEDDFETRLLTDDEEQQYEGFVVEDETLDIVELVSDEVLARIPFQVVCDEDCFGLCATCGKNLNEDECDCEEAIVDSRFEVLKDLFSE